MRNPAISYPPYTKSHSLCQLSIGYSSMVSRGKKRLRKTSLHKILGSSGSQLSYGAVL